MVKPQRPLYSSSVEQVSPALASRLLGKVHPRQQGRHIKGAIDKYARDMSCGEWDVNVPQSIDISVDGELMNGYHRLHAIVKSGVTLPFTVVRNVPTTAFANIDAGRSRSLAFRCGLDKDSSAVASRLLAVCYSGNPLRGAACTPSEMETALDFVRPELQVFMSRLPTTWRKTVTSAPVRLACLLRMKAHPGAVDSLIHSFSCLQQLDLSTASPVITAFFKRMATGDERDKDRIFALAWMAFNPARQANQKLQIVNLQVTIGDAQQVVLRPLMLALGIKPRGDA